MTLHCCETTSNGATGMPEGANPLRRTGGEIASRLMDLVGGRRTHQEGVRHAPLEGNQLCLVRIEQVVPALNPEDQSDQSRATRVPLLRWSIRSGYVAHDPVGAGAA